MQELLERAKEGDKVAIHGLFEKNLPQFKRTIRRKLGREVWRLCGVEDLLQETLMALVFGRLPERVFASPGRFAAYAHRVARNIVCKTNRAHLDFEKRNLRRDVSANEAWRTEEEPAARLPSADEVILERELWEEITAGRPVEIVFLLTWLRVGFSHRDVARAYDVDESNIWGLVKAVREECGKIKVP